MPSSPFCYLKGKAELERQEGLLKDASSQCQAQREHKEELELLLHERDFEEHTATEFRIEQLKNEIDLLMVRPWGRTDSGENDEHCCFDSGD